MLFSLLAAPALLLTCSVSAASTASAQLFISTSTSSPSPSSDSIVLTSHQANAVLAHHLGVSAYEPVPVTSGDRAWEQTLTTGGWGEGNKLVIVLECDAQGCEDYIPESFAAIVPFTLPSLPITSWTALVALHLHRLAEALGTSPSTIWGLEALVQSIKRTDGWAAWVGEELGNAIRWSPLQKVIKTTVMPTRPTHSLLTPLDLLDQSADALIKELESLAELVDSFVAVKSNNDDGPQNGGSKMATIHLSGMKTIAAAHSKTSAEYRTAATLLKQTLSATIAAYSSVSPDTTIVLLALPPYQAPLLYRRSAWLAPFDTYSRYMSARKASQQPDSPAVVRRSMSGNSAKKVVKRVPVPIVPTSSMCFASADAVRNATDSCSGRGTPVAGISSVSGKTACWVCGCGETTEGGVITQWAGEGCEKADLSSDFFLLFFSSFGLLVVLLASVILLYNVGTIELPGTLASVAGAKRD